MERVEIDFLELEREVMHFISHNTTWVLSNAVEKHVTARSIFTAGNGLIFFFQTDKNFLKHKQMTLNPNVALCRDNFQIEGMAKEIGHPLETYGQANVSRRAHDFLQKGLPGKLHQAFPITIRAKSSQNQQ